VDDVLAGDFSFGVAGYRRELAADVYDFVRRVRTYIFLSGTDSTLPVFIWSMLRFPPKLPLVLALGACILAASFVMVTFSGWVRRCGVQLKDDSGA
jgi:hypothetical protein